MKDKKDITISTQDVKDFKITYCDENSIIKNILTKEFIHYFEEPILDVGSGTADILSEVIPQKDVTHLDVLDFSDIKVPPTHKRITGDIFDTELIEYLSPIKTLFMSHVQQFIDSDIERLEKIITKINARQILLVEDVNDDFLGEIAQFSLKNFADANPEIKIKEFPYGYKKIKSVPFKATLTCPTFTELAKQCLYLMDTGHSKENLAIMSSFLEEHLPSPRFTINQEVVLYSR